MCDIQIDLVKHYTLATTMIKLGELLSIPNRDCKKLVGSHSVWAWGSKVMVCSIDGCLESCVVRLLHTNRELEKRAFNGYSPR